MLARSPASFFSTYFFIHVSKDLPAAVSLPVKWIRTMSSQRTVIRSSRSRGMILIVASAGAGPSVRSKM